MKTDDYGLSARDQLALDAAKLSLAGMDQREVAQHLFVNRATVSKLLKTAREKGLIHSEVRDPREHDTELIDTLASRFGLATVRVVAPVGRGPMDMRRALGAAGARVLETLVQDGDRVGIWWSTTTGILASEFAPRHVRGVRVVDLNGGSYAEREGAIRHGRSDLSATCGTEPSRLDTPLIFPSLDDKLEAENSPDVRAVLRDQARARIALFGTSSAKAFLSAVGEKEFSAGERLAVSRRAVGHVCGRLIDSHARICAPVANQRTLGLSLPALRDVEQKVLVAGGPDKVEAIRALVRGRYANHLVTDTATARALLLDEE